MLNIQRYESHPGEVKAVHLTDGNLKEAALWCGGAAFLPMILDGRHLDGYVEIQTMDGLLRADPGDWIVQTDQGHYPFKSETFEVSFDYLGQVNDPHTGVLF